LVSSEAVEVELEKLKDLDQREKVLRLLQFTAIQVNLNQEIDDRSQELEKLGFGLYDSFHLACAEVAEADVLLTIDDRFLKKPLAIRAN
jgi:predicted nucleic acid-binding protein